MTSNLLAVIGESVEQSDLRYGTPVRVGPESRVYKKAGYDIQVHFFEGLTDSVTYKKYLLDKHGKLDEISFEEIAVLLDNNSNGQEWKGLAKQYQEEYPVEKSWVCKNKKIPLQAYYEDESRTLSIFFNDNKKLKEIYLRRTRVDHEKMLSTLGI